MPDDVAPLGRYSHWQAARLVGVSAARLGQWRRRGLIHATGGGGAYSYPDVAEALLIHYLTEELGFSVRRVTRVITKLRKKWGRWPLTNAPLEHDGAFLVIQEEGEYFAVERPEQRVVEKTLDLRLLQVALNHGGWVSIDTKRPEIEVNPERLQGRPTIRGRRMPTDLIVEISRASDGRRSLRDEYELTERQINAAVDYERAVRALAA